MFLDALDLAPAARADFVVRACGDDLELREAVLRMLGEDQGRLDPEFLAPPTPSPAGEPSSDFPRSLGDFELLEELGRGGMGAVVLRAWQRSLGREVAVKVLPRGVYLSNEVERFHREARAAAKLQHPGIVSVITTGREGETRWFAMDLVEGQDLASELAQLREEVAGRASTRVHLPSTRAHDYFREVARIVRDVADALDHAHTHGIVHRDVKPSNVLLDHHGGVHVIDFGLALDRELETITEADVIAGTLPYMSPEQARARRVEIDRRTDVYSLGVILYELLTLQTPFSGSSKHELISQIIHDEPTAARRVNARIPRDLETICEGAMAKQPKERYRTAAELRDDLTRFLSHEAILRKPTNLVRRALRRAHRHRHVLTVVGVALLALLVGGWAVDELARRGRVQEHLAAIEAGLAQGSFAELPPGRRLELVERLRSLRAEPGVRAAGDDAAAQLERELAAFRDDVLTGFVDDLDAAADPARPEGERELLRLAALQRVLEAASLFPADEEVQRLARSESVHPTLTVVALGADGTPTPARVALRTISFETTQPGPLVELGRTPLTDHPVPPGYHRLVVVFDAGGHREVPVRPGAAFPRLSVEVRRRADERRLTEGMVFVPGGPYTFPDYRGSPLYQGRTVELAAFHVSPTEVSNREYAAFLDATGHAEPRYWDLIDDRAEFLAAYGARPVVGVAWEDAVAYATWAGLRLPTLAEFHRYAGGSGNWPTPYAADVAAASRGNVATGPASGDAAEDYWRLYLAHSRDVTSDAEARTEEGLHHVYGNVREFTETMPLTPSAAGGALTPKVHDRFAVGASWAVDEGGARMRDEYFQPIGVMGRRSTLGFRCVKSLTP